MITGFPLEQKINGLLPGAYFVIQIMTNREYSNATTCSSMDKKLNHNKETRNSSNITQ